jgi:protein TonB
MPRELFTDVVDLSIRVGTRPRYSIALSIASHLTLFGIVVVAPLMAARNLPAVAKVIVFTGSAPIPEPPEPPVTAARPGAVQPNDVLVEVPLLPMPQTSLPVSSVADGLALPAHSLVDSITTTVPSLGPDAAATLTEAPSQDDARVLAVGGNVRAPVKIRDVAPSYPAVARIARVQGVVVLQAIIAKDGTVRDLRVVKSVPLLDQAAVDAVRGWRYTQPTLNGVPVEVSMTVKVAFTLN